MVPLWHRAYVRSHPLGLTVSVGVCISGFVALAFPGLAEGSSPTRALPDWTLIVFNVVLMIGGGLATWGLLRGNVNFEVPGLFLLAGGLASFYFTVVSVRPTSALQVIFIGALAIGCAARGWHLAHYGYDGSMHSGEGHR